MWSSLRLFFADWKGKLRLVSAIVVRKGEFFLIVKKPRKDHAWQFPQGGVEKDESSASAALRELQEECGKTLKIKLLDDRSIGGYRYFFPSDFDCHEEGFVGAKVQFFIADFLEGEVRLDQKELEDSLWVKKEQFSEYFSQDYLNVIQKLV